MTLATEAQLEQLSTALDAHNRALDAYGCNPSHTLAAAHVRSVNVLLDACLDAGMSLDEPGIVEWAAERVARWLMAA